MSVQFVVQGHGRTVMEKTELKIGCKLVIESVSEDGRRFRPSDWIERISTQAAQFGSDHRIHYSSLVQPRVIDGAKCLVVEQSLQEENPRVYDHIITFVRANKLRVHEECESDREAGSQIEVGR